MVQASVADPNPNRMDPHDFGLLDSHPESAFQMRIPDADADLDPATKFVLLIRASILCDTILTYKHFVAFRKTVYFKGTVQREFGSVY